MGIASSSVVPTLVNKNYDMSYAQTDEEKRYDEIFEINLQKHTNLNNSIDYSKTYKKFIYEDFIDFATDKTIKDWKIETVDTIFIKTDKAIHALTKRK